jgi:hypothetical protein
VAIAPHGRFFVTAAETSVLVWPGPPEWRELVCGQLGRNMSREQWARWVDEEVPYQVQCPKLPSPVAAKAE